MKNRLILSLALAVSIPIRLLAATAAVEPKAQEPAGAGLKVKIPEPGVPQIMTIKGRYIRAAYNNEGYAILGYKTANLSVGQEWMLLDVGLALTPTGK